MLTPRAKRYVAFLMLAILLVGIATIDQTRGGPATMLTRCNLLLARSEHPPADVLLIGSSRMGVALDPVAIQNVLRAETASSLLVERLAIGNVTLRVSNALLETYIDHRGGPEIVVLEAAFMTPRTIKRLEQIANGKPPEHYLLSRDLNLMTFGQLISQPAVAMPYTEREKLYTLWKVRMRSVLLRAGALVYQFAKAPLDDWSHERCDQSDITREASWPADFAFAYGDYLIEGDVGNSIGHLQSKVTELSKERVLQSWQQETVSGQVYPYDIDADYRQGEMTYFIEMVRKAQASGARVIILPLPLYGHQIDPADLAALRNVLPDQATILDLYGQISVDFRKFWYDDAHIEMYPTGFLTTAIMAEYLRAAFEGQVIP